mmetsp:Transcript_45231/g.75015  ORF Transcript_45231/g.75015 Transcript_45231/m.75015 type:complete len:397 (-) Transcript_45231:413-1603(-)
MMPHVQTFALHLPFVSLDLIDQFPIGRIQPRLVQIRRGQRAHHPVIVVHVIVPSRFRLNIVSFRVGHFFIVVVVRVRTLIKCVILVMYIIIQQVFQVIVHIVDCILICHVILFFIILVIGVLIILFVFIVAEILVIFIGIVRIVICVFIIVIAKQVQIRLILCLVLVILIIRVDIITVRIIIQIIIIIVIRQQIAVIQLQKCRSRFLLVLCMQLFSFCFCFSFIMFYRRLDFFFGGFLSLSQQFLFILERRMLFLFMLFNLSFDRLFNLMMLLLLCRVLLIVHFKLFAHPRRQPLVPVTIRRHIDHWKLVRNMFRNQQTFLLLGLQSSAFFLHLLFNRFLQRMIDRCLHLLFRHAGMRLRLLQCINLLLQRHSFCFQLLHMLLHFRVMWRRRRLWW